MTRPRHRLPVVAALLAAEAVGPAAIEATSRDVDRLFRGARPAWGPWRMSWAPVLAALRMKAPKRGKRRRR